MSIEHKAFLFDHDAFQRELAPILAACLDGTDVAPVRDFIAEHLAALRDPLEGAPLAEGWESLVEEPDAHQYGDLALTRYYDPTDDIGLGPDFEDLEQVLADIDVPDAVVFGETFGPPEAPFDPGKMGSYFQSPEAVRANLALVEGAARRHPEEQETLRWIVDLLKRAADAGRGLYVTF